MRSFFLPAPALVLAAVSALPAAESTTIDLRLHGGLANGSGTYAALVLASTAYGDAAAHGPQGAALVGLAASLRLQLSQLEVEAGGRTADVDLSGGEIGLGLGLWVSELLTVAVLARFGAGFGSSRGGVSFDGDDGDYVMGGLLVGAEWTFENRFQIAFELGFSRYELSFDDEGTKRKGTGDGVDLGIGAGYRF